MKINEIRALTGMNRTKFAERYGIPLRTVEDWEAGKSNPPEYLVPLLERAVKDDFGYLPTVYFVVVISKNSRCEEEYTLCVTKNIYEARKVAREEAYIAMRDHNDETIEIRVYRENIEDENFNCYDYDTVEF